MANQRWPKKKKIRFTMTTTPTASAAPKFTSVLSDDLLLEILLRLPNYQSIIQCSLVCKRWFSLIFLSRHFVRSFDHRKQREFQTAATKFMSVVPDDVLGEIFLRLPDYQSLIRCGLVCKSWYSLIFRHEGCYYNFGRCFNHLHRQKRQRLDPYDAHSLPSTLLIRNLRSQESHDYFTEKAKKRVQGQGFTLSFTVSSNCLGFLDWSDFAVIRSCFDDLLLLQRDLRSFCVCNPITGQCVALPEAPDLCHGEYRCGLVCDPHSCCNEGVTLGLGYCNCKIKYRVVVLSELAISIFCSETGEWKVYSRIKFPVSLSSWHQAPAGSNGVLYWPYGNFDLFKGIVAFDPFKETCFTVSLPPGFCQTWKSKDHSARLGVVRGKLRLSQFFWKRELKSHVLKTWELDETATSLCLESSWLLVDCVALRRSHISMFLIALHPDDEDVVFFTIKDGRGNVDICRYNIERHDCENVCEFPNISHLPSACAFTLVHPWWPTTIPALPGV